MLEWIQHGHLHSFWILEKLVYIKYELFCESNCHLASTLLLILSSINNHHLRIPTKFISILFNTAILSDSGMLCPQIPELSRKIVEINPKSNKPLYLLHWCLRYSWKSDRLVIILHFFCLVRHVLTCSMGILVLFAHAHTICSNPWNCSLLRNNATK